MHFWKLVSCLKKQDCYGFGSLTQFYCLPVLPTSIPPRGEVNAADAFDIGNFDDEETKGIKLNDTDQEQYKHFDLVVSTRWQKEICGKHLTDVAFCVENFLLFCTRTNTSANLPESQ